MAVSRPPFFSANAISMRLPWSRAMPKVGRPTPKPGADDPSLRLCAVWSTGSSQERPPGTVADQRASRRETSRRVRIDDPLVCFRTRLLTTGYNAGTDSRGGVRRVSLRLYSTLSRDFEELQPAG